MSAIHASDVLQVYPVGLFDDVRHRKTWRRGVRYLRTQIRRRNWRAVRNYFNGFLAEHDNHPHNCGRGWTKARARRRVNMLCRRSGSDSPPCLRELAEAWRWLSPSDKYRLMEGHHDLYWAAARTAEMEIVKQQYAILARLRDRPPLRREEGPWETRRQSRTK